MHKGKRNAIVKALTKAGWGDAVRTDWECDGDLIIIAEQDFGKGRAGEYYAFGGEYDDFGVHNEINEIVRRSSGDICMELRLNIEVASRKFSAISVMQHIVLSPLHIIL